MPQRQRQRQQRRREGEGRRKTVAEGGEEAEVEVAGQEGRAEKDGAPASARGPVGAWDGGESNSLLGSVRQEGTRAAPLRRNDEQGPSRRSDEEREVVDDNDDDDDDDREIRRLFQQMKHEATLREREAGSVPSRSRGGRLANCWALGEMDSGEEEEEEEEGIKMVDDR